MNLRKLKPVLPLMASPVMVPDAGTTGSNVASYLIGAFIAIFILGYLVYSLLKPDKF